MVPSVHAIGTFNYLFHVLFVAVCRLCSSNMNSWTRVKQTQFSILKWVCTTPPISKRNAICNSFRRAFSPFDSIEQNFPFYIEKFIAKCTMSFTAQLICLFRVQQYHIVQILCTTRRRWCLLPERTLLNGSDGYNPLTLIAQCYIIVTC